MSESVRMRRILWRRLLLLLLAVVGLLEGITGGLEERGLPLPPDLASAMFELMARSLTAGRAFTAILFMPAVSLYGDTPSWVTCRSAPGKRTVRVVIREKEIVTDGGGWRATKAEGMEVVAVGFAKKGFKGGFTERDTEVEEMAALARDTVAMDTALPQ